ncbi:MAG: hypothetical protein M1133_15650 [Armatimonadetes bacterium]|nr:hypothetical protein [Armatimonadota bacterium]
MSFLSRVIKKFGSYGEQFTVGSNTYRGVFRPLDSGTMNTYLDDVEKMGVVKPGLVLTTQGDAVINVDDTITRDSRTYTVLKTSLHRIGGVAVVKVVILA